MKVSNGINVTRIYQEQLKKANEQIESLKNQQPADEEIPLPEEAPAESRSL